MASEQLVLQDVDEDRLMEIEITEEEVLQVENKLKLGGISAAEMICRLRKQALSLNDKIHELENSNQKLEAKVVDFEEVKKKLENEVVWFKTETMCSEIEKQQLKDELYNRSVLRSVVVDIAERVCEKTWDISETGISEIRNLLRETGYSEAKLNKSGDIAYLANLAEGMGRIFLSRLQEKSISVVFGRSDYTHNFYVDNFKRLRSAYELELKEEFLAKTPKIPKTPAITYKPSIITKTSAEQTISNSLAEQTISPSQKYLQYSERSTRLFYNFFDNRFPNIYKHGIHIASYLQDSDKRNMALVNRASYTFFYPNSIFKAERQWFKEVNHKLEAEVGRFKVEKQRIEKVNQQIEAEKQQLTDKVVDVEKFLEAEVVQLEEINQKLEVLNYQFTDKVVDFEKVKKRENQKLKESNDQPSKVFSAYRAEAEDAHRKLEGKTDREVFIENERERKKGEELAFRIAIHKIVAEVRSRKWEEKFVDIPTGIVDVRKLLIKVKYDENMNDEDVKSLAKGIKDIFEEKLDTPSFFRGSDSKAFYETRAQKIGCLLSALDGYDSVPTSRSDSLFNGGGAGRMESSSEKTRGNNYH